MPERTQLQQAERFCDGLSELNLRHMLQEFNAKNKNKKPNRMYFWPLEPQCCFSCMGRQM